MIRYKLIKQLLDFLFAIVLFALLSPIFLLVFICLFISNNKKVFFIQERPGKTEKLFKIIKFKSMNDNKDKYGNLLPIENRVTKLGSFIRKYSLDEIPQLLNVIKGDMSLIGPRPLLPQYLPYYNLNEKKRHTVKPGITGLAQINGRKLIGWDKRLKLDVYYVDNLSFKMDLDILLKTIYKVVASKDVLPDNANVENLLNIERENLIIN